MLERTKVSLFVRYLRMLEFSILITCNTIDTFSLLIVENIQISFYELFKTV